MARTALKTQIRDLLAAGDLEGVADTAVARRRTLGQLVSLTFDHDPLIVYRAIQAVGICARRLAPVDEESVLELLRRLNWMITEESGGICWHAPEMMAEIVGQAPERFSDFLDVIASLLITMEPEDLEHFRPSALRALGLLGGSWKDLSEELKADLLPAVTDALDSPDPQVRAEAVQALLSLGETAPLQDHPGLRSDSGEVDHYHEGQLDRITVGELTGILPF